MAKSVKKDIDFEDPNKEWNQKDVMKWLESFEAEDPENEQIGSVLVPLENLVGVTEFGKRAMGWEVYADDGVTVAASGLEKSFSDAFNAMLTLWDELGKEEK